MDEINELRELRSYMAQTLIQEICLISVSLKSHRRVLMADIPDFIMKFHKNYDRSEVLLQNFKEKYTSVIISELPGKFTETYQNETIVIKDSRIKIEEPQENPYIYSPVNQDLIGI